jgi:putative colanic acid biosynthesis glycosyltransferase
MKLIQINTSANTSSTGKIAHQISTLSIDNGYESIIAFSGRFTENKDSPKFLRIGTKLDFYLHAFFTRIFDKHGFGSIKATKKLLKQIDIFKPDIIHLHNLHGYYINIEILFNYLAMANIPIVWTMHDCWALTGHCSHFEYVSCEKWKTHCYNCPQKSSYPSSFLLDNSKSNFEKKKKLFNSVSNMTVVPVSKWLEAQTKLSHLKGFNSTVIQNGVDLKIFKPSPSESFRKKHNLIGKFILLGVASNWSKRKGFFEFVKLRELLSDEFVIIMVGVDEKLEKKLPNGIVPINRTDNQVDLAEIYSSSDLYLNLTFEDTYPTTNLESISSGTPVITYRTGGSPESLINGTGYVVAQGDINHLIKIIEDTKNGVIPLISQKKLFDTAQNYFNKDINFVKYLDLYNKILEV